MFVSVNLFTVFLQDYFQHVFQCFEVDPSNIFLSSADQIQKRNMAHHRYTLFPPHPAQSVRHCCPML